jgi:hypothetical protein
MAARRRRYLVEQRLARHRLEILIHRLVLRRILRLAGRKSQPYVIRHAGAIHGGQGGATGIGDLADETRSLRFRQSLREGGRERLEPLDDVAGRRVGRANVARC